MKALIQAIALSCAMALPMLVSAQVSSVSPTHAEVRADLVRLEQVGYRASAAEANYPADIQAAEAKVATHQTITSNAYGGVMSGSSQSGFQAVTTTHHAVFGPLTPQIVGDVSAGYAASSASATAISVDADARCSGRRTSGV
ncbi:DUF4148 domain-containing protein [Paraburkholderia sp.]|uniref:DUF4148 domain-containing protein n=1 Tax=Paraburkholderia sp. TaxID=1926495 RepID=UPI003441AF83